MTKYIFICGGVCSSLGKGVAAASLGSLIECSGIAVTLVKCDPYINVDAGTMSPYQNGEVYVTADGGETDADIGTFARFTTFSPTKEHSITTGQIYETVIRNERAGRYNGRTVQVIPHITDEIKRRILAASMTGTFSADAPEDHVVIIDIGGTVGDIESIPYLEATRQLIRELGKNDALSVYLTLVPILTGGEMKTKPTQHAVKTLQETGIQPDILLCRCEVPLDDELRTKIALFCNVAPSSVFTTTDVKKSIYELPVLFHKQGLDQKILSRLGFADKKVNIRPWTAFAAKLESPQKQVCIALVGKTSLDDCYKSIREALLHAAVTDHNAEVVIRRVDAEDLEQLPDVAAAFVGVDGILVPDNFGQRGFLGLLAAIRYARENQVPYLGIDFGMQLMPIEIARTLLGWEDADSTEFVRKTAHPVISLPEEQAGGLSSSGFFKLGLGGVTLEKNTKLYDIYRKKTITERHRNKYTFNPRFAPAILDHGLRVSACAQDKQAEAFEWEGHPWGIGVQYHPEFASRPLKPHPLFSAFLAAALVPRGESLPLWENAP